MVYEYGKQHKVGTQMTEFGETLMPRAKCLLGHPRPARPKVHTRHPRRAGSWWRRALPKIVTLYGYMPTTQSSKLCVQLNRLLSLYSGIGNQFKGLGVQRILAERYRERLRRVPQSYLRSTLDQPGLTWLILLKRTVR